MVEENKILVTTEDGKEEVVELVLSVDKGDKKYLLYIDANNEMYASYILNSKDDNLLHNDLTEDEYEMLESLYNKGHRIYDK